MECVFLKVKKKLKKHLDEDYYQNFKHIQKALNIMKIINCNLSI